MDKNKKTEKKCIISSSNNPNDIEHNVNVPRDNDETVPNPDIVDETNRLYMDHLTRQMSNSDYSVRLLCENPENRDYLRPPQNGNTLQALARRFELSPQRRWVHEQAQNVDLDSLNFSTFQQLMSGLFQEGGFTWERVLVLFYFCTDLSIRALQERVRGCFVRIHNWTTRYISRRLSSWIQQEGGWDVVLRVTVELEDPLNLYLISVCCIGVILLCLYIKTR